MHNQHGNSYKKVKEHKFIIYFNIVVKLNNKDIRMKKNNRNLPPQSERNAIAHNDMQAVRQSI